MWMRWRAIGQSRRVRWGTGLVIGVVALLLVVLAAFPWDMLRGMAQRRASDTFGRPVTIGRIERLDTFSFTPTIAVHDIRVPQPAWAGPGDLAQVKSATMRFSAWGLLVGRFKPLGLTIDGMRLVLVRDRNKRESWRKLGEAPGAHAPPSIADLTIRHARVVYRDALQDRAVAVDVTSDARGFRASGDGRVMGRPVTVSFSAPAVAAHAGKPWPFTARIAGDALAMDAHGTMDVPLDIRHGTLHVAARADDLKLIDAIIEAGLIGTQPVRLQAHVRRDDDSWRIPALSGTIGHSQLTGHLVVTKRDNRHRLDGTFTAAALDFDDFATNQGRAQAAALIATEGPRLVPDLHVNLAKIGATDGNVDFVIDRLIGGSAGALRSVKGRLTLDHQLLTVDPLVFAMNAGTLSGKATVDQRGNKPVPQVTLDLRLAGSNVAAIAGSAGGVVDARFDARAVLSGSGSTLREAVGRSSGRIGVVARDGQLPAKLASYLGFDAGRGLFTGGGEEAGLRCLVGRFVMRDGIGRADPFVLDTTRSQAIGDGTLRFPSEALDLRLTGRPKQKIVLRLPGAIDVRGTLKQPDITAEPGMKSVGNIFKAIGRAITGDQGPLAADADCGALAAAALR